MSRGNRRQKPGASFLIGRPIEINIKMVHFGAPPPPRRPWDWTPWLGVAGALVTIASVSGRFSERPHQSLTAFAPRPPAHTTRQHIAYITGVIKRADGEVATIVSYELVPVSSTDTYTPRWQSHDFARRI